MTKSYKYRIYPTIKQQKELFNIFDICRCLYNSALEERISFYKKYKKSLSYYSQAAEFKLLKDSFPKELENVYSQTKQSVLKQLDSAYKSFFNRKKSKKSGGFPRFKSIDRFRSILFPQCNLKLGGIKLLDNKKIKIFGISGEIKVKWHREFQGVCKTVRISRNSAGEYYIILTCKNVPKISREKTGKIIGIDLGIENFITTNDGITFHHLKPYKTSKEKLAFLQRKRANSQKHSNRNKKLKYRIAKQHQHIENIRRDLQHKLSTKLVKENDVICVEKLNIEKMLESKGYVVNKSNITDASWGSFTAMLKYKAESADILVIEVNPAYTSKRCSKCGNIKNNLELKDRIYICEVCNLAIDRDKNAALNILRAGTARMYEMEAVAFIQR